MPFRGSFPFQGRQDSSVSRVSSSPASSELDCSLPHWKTNQFAKSDYPATSTPLRVPCQELVRKEVLGKASWKSFLEKGMNYSLVRRVYRTPVAKEDSGSGSSLSGRGASIGILVEAATKKTCPKPCGSWPRERS